MLVPIIRLTLFVLYSLIAAKSSSCFVNELLQLPVEINNLFELWRTKGNPNPLFCKSVDDIPLVTAAAM